MAFSAIIGGDAMAVAKENINGGGHAGYIFIFFTISCFGCLLVSVVQSALEQILANRIHGVRYDSHQKALDLLQSRKMHEFRNLARHAFTGSIITVILSCGAYMYMQGKDHSAVVIMSLVMFGILLAIIAWLVHSMLQLHVSGVKGTLEDTITKSMLDLKEMLHPSQRKRGVAPGAGAGGPSSLTRLQSELDVKSLHAYRPGESLSVPTSRRKRLSSKKKAAQYRGTMGHHGLHRFQEAGHRVINLNRAVRRERPPRIEEEGDSDESSD